MTEEIIIDGVNVAECSYYSSETYPYTCEVWDNECEAQNCYYKQFLRLKQENDNFEILAKSLYERIEELEKENEALAFRERLYKDDYEASEQENAEQAQLDGECIDKLIEARDIYAKALEEIREIILFDNSMLVNKGEYVELHTGEPLATKIQKILNKINGVLGNEI